MRPRLPPSCLADRLALGASLRPVQLPLHCVRKPEFWVDYHPSHKLPSPPVPTEGTDYPCNELVRARSPGGGRLGVALAGVQS